MASATRTSRRRRTASRAPGAGSNGRRGARRAKPSNRRPTKRARSSGAGRRVRKRRLNWRGRALVAAVLGAALAGVYLGWLRDSSLVSIDHLRVEGVSSSEHDQIAGALTRAADGMTTLHYDEQELAAAAGQFPSVASIDVATSFPDAMTVQVRERRPTLMASDGERSAPIAPDGTILTGLDVPESERDALPRLVVSKLPQEGRLENEALDQALILGAAPKPLVGLIEGSEYSSDHGVELTMRGDIPIRFGAGGEADEKWAAASAVLADPELTGLGYLDVSVPERPAVGGG